MITTRISVWCMTIAARLMFWAARIAGATDITLRVYENTPEVWMMDLSVTGPKAASARTGRIQ